LRYSWVQKEDREACHPYVFGFLGDDITAPDGGSKTKDKIQAILHNEIFCLEDIHDGVGVLLGRATEPQLSKISVHPCYEAWLSSRGEGSSRTVEERQACFGGI
jgi:hypothetical protein